MKQGALKRTVIVLWSISVSVFLYFFSVGIEQQISLFNFIAFTILLFGGGVAYHVVTELIACPQTAENEAMWRSVLWYLAKMAVGYLIAGAAILVGIWFSSDWSWLVALVGLIVGYLWVLHYLKQVRRPISALLATTEVSPESAGGN